MLSCSPLSSFIQSEFGQLVTARNPKAHYVRKLDEFFSTINPSSLKRQKEVLGVVLDSSPYDYGAKMSLTDRIRIWSVVASLCWVSNSCVADVIEFFDYAAFETKTNLLTIATFDTVAKQTLLTGDEFSGFRVSARRITVLDPQDFAPGLELGGANINSQPHGISASLLYSGSSIQFDDGDDDFTISLDSPSIAAGLWVGSLGGSSNDPITPTVVSFFDTAGGLIASESLTQASNGLIGSGANNRIFYGITSSTLISSFTVANAASNGDGIILDDIQFSAVPEPNTSLLLLGCALVLILRREKSIVA